MRETTRERLVQGQAQRKHLRRAEHAAWDQDLRREDPLKLLAASMRGRVSALVRIKYDRMACSPFGFFRGAVPIMASDLALAPHTGIFTQLCGDAHVRNLGAFAAPDGRLVFDINDFDETIRGPFEWDVKRMAASLVLAGREAGAKHAICHAAALRFLGSYRRAMFNFARMPVLELARYTVHRLNTVRPVAQIFAVAERATPLHSLDSLTEPVRPAGPRGRNSSADSRTASTSLTPPAGGTRIFRTHPPDLTRIHGRLARSVLDSLETYAETLQPE